METIPEVEKNTGFVKVGNNYVYAENIERFTVNDGNVFLSTVSGEDITLHKKSSQDAFTMDSVIRKLSEKAHDIIYLEAYMNGNESMIPDDQQGNLMYRKWLARLDDPPPPAQDEHRVEAVQSVKPPKKRFWEKSKK